MGRPANLVVNILGNNADFLRAVGSSQTALNKFGGLASGVMTGIATAWTGAAAAAGAFAVSVFKTGVEYNTLNQKANAAFSTILGSADAAAKMMGDITAFAKTSPFPRQAFITAAQQMLAFGYAAGKVIPTLGAVQNAVAASGGGAQQLSEVTYVLSQIQAAGKITATDLMQLGQRGINAASLIGSQMGKTGAQIREDITAGALPAAKALDLLAAGMEERFGGAADAVKQTWVGATDRIKGAIRDIGALMADPFITATGGGLGVDWANKLADILRGIQPVIDALVDKIMGAFGGQFATVGTVLDRVSAALKGIDVGAVADNILKFAPILGALTGAFAAMAGGLGSKIPVLGGLLSSLASPLGILVAAIGGLVATSPELQSMLGGILTDAMKALAPLVPVITSALQRLAGILGQVLDAIAPLIPVIAGVLVQAFTALVPPLMRIVEAALPPFLALVELLAPIITALGDVFVTLVEPLAVLLDAFMKIASAALPPLMSLVQMLTPLITGIADAFVLLAEPIMGIIRQLLPPLTMLLDILIAALEPIIPVVVDLVKAIVGLAVTAIMPLLPPLSKMLMALLPLIDPIMKIIEVVAELLVAFMPIIDVVTLLTSQVLAALIDILVKVSGKFTDLLLPVLELVAGWLEDLIGWVEDFVSWLGKIKWPEPPEWLSGIGKGIGDLFGGGKSATTQLALVTPSATPRAAGLAAPSLLGPPTAPVTINLTVNAPTGDGDSIARTVESALLNLSRRRTGVQIGGTRPRLGAVFA